MNKRLIPPAVRIIIGFLLTLMMFFWSVTSRADELPDPVSFRISIEMGDTEKASQWLDRGLDPNFQGDQLGGGLHIAAWNGDTKMLALFMAKGARINLLNKNGETPLHMASLQGKMAAAEWLIGKGANINPDPRAAAWSALHYAAFSGKKELVTRLLEKGADINARAPNGTTPLMSAIYEGKRDVADYLVRLGADRTLKNDWGDGAFEWAVKYNQTDLAQLISSREQFSSAFSRPTQRKAELPTEKPRMTLLSPLVIQPTASQKKRLQAQ
jgi:ankyrin repeat protein